MVPKRLFLASVVFVLWSISAFTLASTPHVIPSALLDLVCDIPELSAPVKNEQHFGSCVTVNKSDQVAWLTFWADNPGINHGTMRMFSEHPDTPTLVITMTPLKDKLQWKSILRKFSSDEPLQTGEQAEITFRVAEGFAKLGKWNGTIYMQVKVN